MPGTNIGSDALSGAATGATVGSIVPGVGTAIGAGVGGLISLLGGIFASSSTPQEEAYKQAMDAIKQYMPELKQEAFTKDEISKLVQDLRLMFTGASDVAAGKIGSAIGESGVAKGGGFADYYTQALAPVIAQGQQMAGQATEWGVNTYSDINNATKQRVLQGLQLMTGAAAGQPSMTPGQKGVSGFLQSLNLLSTGAGNFANLYKTLNMKYPSTVNTNGTIG